MSNSRSDLDVVFKAKDAVEIAELVSSDVFKILENIYLPQREAIIGRLALDAQNEQQLWLLKGQREEARRFFKILKDIKKNLEAQAKDE